MFTKILVVLLTAYFLEISSASVLTGQTSQAAQVPFNKNSLIVNKDVQNLKTNLHDNTLTSKPVESKSQASLTNNSIVNGSRQDTKTISQPATFEKNKVYSEFSTSPAIQQKSSKNQQGKIYNSSDLKHSSSNGSSNNKNNEVQNLKYKEEKENIKTKEGKEEEVEEEIEEDEEEVEEEIEEDEEEVEEEIEEDEEEVEEEIEEDEEEVEEEIEEEEEEIEEEEEEVEEEEEEVEDELEENEKDSNKIKFDLELIQQSNNKPKYNSFSNSRSNLPSTLLTDKKDSQQYEDNNQNYNLKAKNNDQNQIDVNNYSLNYSNKKPTYEDEESETIFNSDHLHLNNENELLNSQKLLNGYKTMKKILFLVHDYASLTYNWIINKINYQIENIKELKNSQDFK